MIPPYYPDHPVTREDWAKYLDAATELDRKVGLILEQLEADGLADRHVVVFFGDNGQAHVRGKQFCYDSGLHVPLIIRWPKGFAAPKHFRPGTVDERLIAAIDLLPTMLDIAGAKKPAKMQGEVFLGEHAAPPAAVRLRRPRPLRRDRLPLPHGPRRPLPLHPQLHARAPVPAAQRLQGAAVSRLEPAQGTRPRRAS